MRIFYALYAQRKDVSYSPMRTQLTSLTSYDALRASPPYLLPSTLIGRASRRKKIKRFLELQLICRSITREGRERARSLLGVTFN